MSQTSSQADGTEYKHKSAMVNDLYEAEDTSALKRVVYRDDFIVVMRSEVQTNADDEQPQYTHDLLREDEFSNEQAYGRLTYKPNASSPIPEANQGMIQEVDAKQPVDARPDVVSLSDSEPPVAASDSEGDDTYQSDTVTTPGGARSVASKQEEWRNVPFVGETLEARLYDHGFESKADIQLTSETELCEIPQLGKKAARNLKAFAAEGESESWSEVPFIGDKLESRLHEQGYRTKSDMTETSNAELQDVTRIGEEKASELKAFATDTGDGETDTSSETPSNPGDNDTVPTDIDELEDWTTVKYIGNTVMQNLHENGFKTVHDVVEASEGELSDVDQLGEDTITNIQSYARSARVKDMTQSNQAA